jgi:hypothetical protein
LIERRARARRLVEEILGAITCRDEPESLFTDEPFDCAIHRNVDFLDVSALIRDETSMISESPHAVLCKTEQAR